MRTISPFYSYHTGAPGGNQDGLRDHLERLAAAGIPIVTAAADGFPWDAQDVARNYPDLDHVIIFRRSVPHNGSVPPSGDPNVPNYNHAPAVAARDHAGWTLAHLPPELDPAVVYISDVNEPDQERAEWLAAYSIEADAIYKAAGYRYAALGWATGEPELADWTGSSMLELLHRLEVERERMVLAVHEYSLRADAIWTVPAGGEIVPVEGPEFSWLVGRTARALDHVEADLGRAWNGRIVFKEFGWELNDLPPWPLMRDHLTEVMDLYAPRPQIEGGAIWYLGPGFGGIADKAQATIAPETDWATDPANVWERPEDPGGAAPTMLETFWAQAVQEQIDRGIWLNPAAGLQAAILQAGLLIVHREIYPKDPDGTPIPIMAGEHPTLGTRWLFLWEEGQVRGWRSTMAEVRPYDREFWELSVQEQIDRGIQLNPGAGLQNAITTAGLNPVINQLYPSWEGEGYVTQRGEDPYTGEGWLFVYQPGVPIYRWRPGPEAGDYLRVPELSQRDPRWSGDQLGTGRETWGSWGCLATVYNSMAQFLDFTDLAPGAPYNALAVARGAFSGSDLRSMALEDIHPADVEAVGWYSRDRHGWEVMEPKIWDRLAAGWPVPARVDFKPETAVYDQHWILIVGWDNQAEDWLAMDPWTGHISPVAALYDIPGVDLLEVLIYQARPTVEPPPVEPPPGTGEEVDIAAGFIPADGHNSPVYDLQNGSGHNTTTTETVQLRVRDGRSYLIKNGLPEQLRIWTDPQGVRFVERGVDYSLSPDRFYELIDPYRSHWSRWALATMRVGQAYQRQNVKIKVYEKGGSCRLVEESHATSWIRILDHVTTWDPSIPGVWSTGVRATGVTVAEFAWTADGPPVERYYIADGLYLVGWDGPELGGSGIPAYGSGSPAPRWSRIMAFYPDRPHMELPDLGCANWTYTI